MQRNSFDYICSRKCELKLLPFHSLKCEDCDIFDTTKNFLRTFLNLPIVSRSEIHNLVDNDNDNQNKIINCNYLDPNFINEVITENDTFSDLFVFHANVSSLNKNLGRVEDLFQKCEKMPDVLGITETRLKDDPFLVQLTGYRFESHHSQTDAGGVGIYIRDSLQYNIREDLAIDLEHCEEKWVEIIVDTSKKQVKAAKSIVIGIIYRHKENNTKSFQEKLSRNIYNLNQANSSVLILGDININLLKYNLCNTITEYLNDVQSSGCVSFINQPTRVYTRGSRLEISCIDHLYSNIDCSQIEAFIIESDISDHYSTMARIKGVKNVDMSKTNVYKRKSKLSDTEIQCLNADLCAVIQENNAFDNANDVNQKTKSIIDTYHSLLDKYMPLKKLSRKEKAFHFKPLNKTKKMA